MLQPFEIFKVDYIDRLLKIQKRWLVSQSYPRGDCGDSNKHPLLLSDYDDPGLAKVHFNAVKHDKYAAIIDLEKPQHRAKLHQMLFDDSDYKVYWCIVNSAKKLKERVDRRWRGNMERYIKKNTSWPIDRKSPVERSIEVTFGELFVIFKYSSETLRTKFEDIEKA